MNLKIHAAEAPAAEPSPAEAKTAAPTPKLADRLMSLDAYRGFIMLMMVSGGLGTAALYRSHDPQWFWLADQLEHRLWEGCTFWDLIQPSFMFMVGVAMPFAFAKRRERGESWLRQFAHVVKRSLLLILIGMLLDSFGRTAVTVQFIRVLQQIAIGYFLAFFVLSFNWRIQAAAAVLLLGLHTALFVGYGGRPHVDVPDGAAAVAGPLATAYYVHSGDPFERGYNFGYQLDLRMHEPFVEAGYPTVLPPSTGGYATLNALSATATILFGVLAGNLLRSNLRPGRKALILALAGVGGLALGWALTAWIPMVKRVWTASFAIYAAGWTCLMMLGFYAVIDIFRFRRWAFPFVVVGVNSIAIYVSAGILNGTIRNLLMPFLTVPVLRPNPLWGPVVLAVLVVAVQWCLCYWLYRHRVFFKV